MGATRLRPCAGALKNRAWNVDKTEVKGLEKLTSIRLAELLSQKNVVPTDAITDALYTQDRVGEPFIEVIVSSGHITEWDLAKLVVEHFQVPFIMASNYEMGTETKDRLPTEVLFENYLVPLDTFDRVVTVVMPIMTSYEVLDKIEKDHDCELFPYVGLASENKRVLQDLFPEFKAWAAEAEAKREKERRSSSSKKEEGQGDWMNIFDSADAAVRDALD